MTEAAMRGDLPLVKWHYTTCTALFMESKHLLEKYAYNKAVIWLLTHPSIPLRSSCCIHMAQDGDLGVSSVT